MIGLVLMPSSMASRVRSGRQSIAMRSSCAGLWRLLTRSAAPPPARAAMPAAPIGVIAGGRMLLGIGSSGPQVAEGWHGQRFAHQLARTRDYVAILRQALARERVVYEGDEYTLPLPDG